MIYNCHYEYMSFLLCLFMLIFLKTRYLQKPSIKNFEKLIITTMIVTFFHIMLAYCAAFYNSTSPIFCHLIAGIFLVAAVMNFNSYYAYCVSYISNQGSHLMATIFYYAAAVATILALIINYTHPFLYYFDGTRQNALVWLPFGHVREFFPVAYMFIAVGASIRHKSEFVWRQLFAVIGYAVAMSLGIIAQVFIAPDILCVYYAASFALLLILFSLETPDYGKLNAAMQELEIAKKDAERATSAKSAFLARMSHEIRTPINAILGLDEMIIRESRDNGIKKYALDVRNSGQVLLSLINDILDFSKIESGKMEIIEANYDLAELLRETETLIVGRAKAKGLDLYINVDPETPRYLRGDENRIRQIAINLLTNAVKYTEKGQVTLNVGFERTEGVDDFVNITYSVKDTGIGIKPEDMEKIFKPFERINEAENRKIEGTGLGISITQQLLELMGSKLEVESEFGRGSIFRFTLRQEIKEWTYIGDYEAVARTLDATKNAYEETFSAPEARILVVDDVPINLTVVKGLLKNSLMTIDTASSGREALFMCEKNKYDVILIDHMMPDMDGLETAAKIKEGEGVNKDTPLVALTANAISGAKEFYLSEGFSSYIAKPVVPIELERILLRYLPIEKIKEAPVEEKKESDGKNRFIEKLAEIPEINISAGMAASGSPEIYAQVVEEFYNTVDERARKIEEAFGSNNQTGYVTQVHALKTTARLMGYVALSNMAKDLEEKGGSVSLYELKDKTEDLLLLYRGIKEPLAELFEGDDNPEKPLISEEALKDAIKTIYTCEEKFDTEMAEAVFDQLSNYRMPDDFKPVYQKLKSLLAEVARDDIILLLKDLQ
ncbi:Signal transduction histidine kinase [Lachnospiraceae bacterium G11]|nr:Signal transduction histidine kinase [Lachnospiraceae bacterium G11]